MMTLLKYFYIALLLAFAKKIPQPTIFIIHKCKKKCHSCIASYKYIHKVLRHLLSLSVGVVPNRCSFDNIFKKMVGSWIHQRQIQASWTSYSFGCNLYYSYLTLFSLTYTFLYFTKRNDIFLDLGNDYVYSKPLLSATSYWFLWQLSLLYSLSLMLDVSWWISIYDSLACNIKHTQLWHIWHFHYLFSHSFASLSQNLFAF